MSNIDWKAIADAKGLSFEEFKIQLFNAAAQMAGMDIEPDDYENAVKFTTSDDHSSIELYVKRSKQNQIEG